MKIRELALVGLAAAAFSLAACSSAPETTADANSDEPIKIRVQAQNSIAAEPLYMGIEEGFFEDEGLDIEVVDLPDIAAATAALQAGKLELAFVPTISALQMARQNVPITLIAASDGINPAASDATLEEQRDYTSVGIYTSKGSGITDIEGLAGAKIAVPELKGQPDGTITSVLHEAGVETKDIEWMNLGFVPALEALKGDQIDAAFLVSPFSLEADAEGLARVMNPSVDFFPRGSATTGWAASDTWAAENPDAVAAFQRAIAKSATWASDNLEDAKQHVIDRAGLKIEPADMPQSYWPSEIDPAQLEEVDKKLVAIGFFDEPIDVSEILTSRAN
ncbi:NitT/TauT family transport system substrate-binding protein [Leucobacter luti]|uniref:NitT/TauT family transport system substrate-binding protein n=1 Tax=Leucobacter luti TaxID=340320 RepID=A0A4R6S6K9_9MICO|nr:ABC transporter substrate-binding protein [Leucobacter luti]TDP95420.1 NitT/TauT family transport system substrate-binding protein [Leucobacter luti]